MKATRLKKSHITAVLAGLCLALALFFISVGYAYYSSRASVRNTLTTTSSGVFLQELFNPNDHWLPGETKAKEVNFGNSGQSAQVIRFRVEEQWRNAAGEDWLPQQEKAAHINWTLSLKNDWTKIPSADGNVWYYYKHFLEAGEETPTVMDSIVFSQSLSNDSHAEDFTGASFSLVVYLEALDVNAEITKAEWRVWFSGDAPLAWYSLD